MDILHRIRFPIAEDKADLYIKMSGTASITYSVPEVAMGKGGRISLDSYFNSFYEKAYLKYTNITDIKYCLKVNGAFKIDAIRESDSSGRESIGSWMTPDTISADNFIIPLSGLRSGSGGRIYLEIECLGEKGVFSGGEIRTEDPSAGDVSIAAVICTFNRPDTLKKVLNSILSDGELCKKPLDIIVVDNSSSLSQADLPYEKIKIIHNPNVGGSGGFARGLIEFLNSGKYTHVLLMDDDILLESESIYRLFGIYGHASREFVIAGQMLDLVRDSLLYEAGAKYTFFRLIPRKHKLPLRQAGVLNSLLKEEEINYGGFWFFCMPKAVVARVGLPLPLFKHFDDVELGMRIKEVHKIDIASFPGVAVWHKPFDIGRKDYENYYIIRNMLITNGIYRKQPYIFILFILNAYIKLNMLRFWFNRAGMAIDAVEDYMKGPDYLIKDQDGLNSSVLSRYGQYSDLSGTEKLGYILDCIKRWTFLVFRSRSAWYRAGIEWKEFHKKAVTKGFWTAYLGLS